MKHLAWFPQQNAMPYAFGYNQCLSWTYFHDGFSTTLLEDDIDATGNEKEDLIGIWMHLTTVGRIARHEWGADEETINSRRRAGLPRHETGLAVSH